MKATEQEHCTIIGTICPYDHNCDVCRLRNDYDVALKALEEIRQYRAIGTVEECRESVEKQRAVKPTEVSPWQSVSFYMCPVCNEILVIGKGYCCNCGQNLDWGE